MTIRLNKLSALSALGLAAAVSLSACDPKMKFPTVPNPSASSSASPSPTTSATPSPTTSSSPVASSTPTPTVSASAAVGGNLVIKGGELFNKFNVNYRVGMKWVYSLRLADLAVPTIPSIPGFPSGSIPGLPSGSGAGSVSSLGEMSWEVISVDSNTVTIKVSNSINTPAGTQNTQNNVTFEKNSQANLYSLAQAPGTNGTVTWTLGASGESVVVPAGTYNADRIEGNFDVVSQTGAASATSKQQVKTWINSTVGMVKQEVKSDINASGGGASAQTSSTTIMELKSFSG